MIDLKTYKYLLVEDEKENRDLILRILIDELDIPDEKIVEAENLIEAKNAFEEFEPNIVLLDLKIPFDSGHEPEMDNANEFIEKVELFNYKQNFPKDRAKIIVISGSVKDKAVQKLISHDKNIVFDYFDKGIIPGDLNKFKVDLKRKLEKAVEYEGAELSIDYSFIRKSLLKPLSNSNPVLWEKINKQILQEFEKLNNKNANEYAISKAIIINCGEIVEDVLHYFVCDSGSGNGINYSYDDNTVQKKLTKISGRKYDGKNLDTREPIYEIKYEQLIRRISQEYALMAYRLSSQARHSKEDDDNNNKWFTGINAGFTKEDAAIAINLIVPLVQDYINYLK